MEIRRTLAKDQPAAYLPNLAASLNNLANLLSSAGGAPAQAEALACARESVGIYRTLTKDQPEAYERNLQIAQRVLAAVESL